MVYSYRSMNIHLYILTFLAWLCATRKVRLSLIVFWLMLWTFNSLEHAMDTTKRSTVRQRGNSSNKPCIQANPRGAASLGACSRRASQSTTHMHTRGMWLFNWVTNIPRCWIFATCRLNGTDFLCWGQIPGRVCQQECLSSILVTSDAMTWSPEMVQRIQGTVVTLCSGTLMGLIDSNLRHRYDQGCSEQATIRTSSYVTS